MTLGEWLDSVIRQSTRESVPGATASTAQARPLEGSAAELLGRPPQSPDRLSQALDELNARIDDLLESRGAAPVPAPANAALRPAATRTHAPSALEIEQAVADIVARQQALESDAPVHRAPGQPEPPAIAERIPLAPQPAAGPDLSGLQEQLRRLTDQIASLNRPCGMEGAIEGLRKELAQIWRAVTEAMPRRALEALEAEVRALAARLDAERGGRTESEAIAGLARGLAEVRDALQALTPAESLAGLEQTIKALAHKIDAVATNGFGDAALQQIQAAVAGLRDVVAGAASGEALAGLMTELRQISAKIDRLAQADARPGIEIVSKQINVLSQRLAAANAGPDAIAERIQRNTDAIAAKIDQLLKIGPQGESPSIAAKIDQLLAAGPQQGVGAIAGQLEALAEKVERSGDRSSIEKLEAQIRGLMGQIQSANAPLQSLEQIERSVNALAVQLGEARITAVDAAERAAKAVVREVLNGPGASNAEQVHALKSDLSELREQQSASEKRTQSTLEAVHKTLERLVDRLASAEAMRREEIQAIVRRDQEQAAQAMRPPAAERAASPAPGASPGPAPEARPEAAKPSWQAREVRPIDPTLPADTPLEPGTVRPRGRPVASDPIPDRPKDIAPAPASATERAPEPRQAEKANSGNEPATPAPSRASFVAAARRAAQAAQAESAGLSLSADEGAKGARMSVASLLARHRRTLLIGAGAILVVAGLVRVVVTYVGPGAHAPEPAKRETIAPSPSTNGAGSTAPAEKRADPDKHSNLITRPVPTPLPQAGSLSFAPSPAAADITGTVSAPPMSGAAPSFESQPRAATASAPTHKSPEKLPSVIGSLALRAAAENGDPAAAYEVGARYAEGRGVTQSLPDAIRWFERAADAGLAPAQYRLGSMYEKGQGTKKDTEAARRLYIAASEKGNAKAMHNLAVLYAEGAEGKPDYRTAVQWFRRAADRGVADSQYNLGILYARGIGVEQNLAESYKWFSLAAAQGDQDAGKKRDDVTPRLDPQSLVAARLAVQTWTAQPQPEEAVTVTPPGMERPAAAAPAAPAPAAPAARNRPAQRKS